MTEDNMGHWTLTEGLILDEDFFAFVYLIEGCGMKYIGRKQRFVVNHLKPLRGNKNRRKRTSENWADYQGSSKGLNALIAKEGKEKFTFTILHWCKDKRDAQMKETREIILRDCLTKSSYFNKSLFCRIKF